jgi:putative transcriptional regulator
MIKILLSRKLGELRWTQADLARATGIRAATINALYNEVTDRVSLDQLNKICEALDCDLPDIMEYVPNKVKTSGTRLGKKGK